MRHARRRYHLNRFTSLRLATLRSLSRALILHQTIKTTKIKAKAAKRFFEHLLHLAKTDTISRRRLVYRELNDHGLVNRLFGQIAPRFKDISGGYTRIIPWINRRGDNAKLVIWELTQIVKKERPKREAKAKPKEGPPITREAKPEAAKPQIVKEKPKAQKPPKRFLGGIRGLFKKERDSLD